MLAVFLHYRFIFYLSSSTYIICDDLTQGQPPFSTKFISISIFYEKDLFIFLCKCQFFLMMPNLWRLSYILTKYNILLRIVCWFLTKNLSILPPFLKKLTNHNKWVYRNFKVSYLLAIFELSEAFFVD